MKHLNARQRRIRRFIIAAACLQAMSSCNVFQFAGRGELAVKDFKTEIPMRIEKDMAIAVPLRLGRDTASYSFHFDTHAAESTYGEGTAISRSRHLSYLGASSLKITTTSGEQIKRSYYNADSILLGRILATDVSLLKMPGSKAQTADTTFPQFDGILGLNLLRKGIWKIDFEHNNLVFTSSMDSLSDVGDKRFFAESNLFDIFKTEVSLPGLKKKASVDLGASTGIFIPLGDMKKLQHFDRAEVKKGSKKTAAGISEETYYRLPAEEVSIDGQPFGKAKVTGSNNQQEAVIGLSFFRQFRYVILDYPGRKMYVSSSAGSVALLPVR